MILDSFKLARVTFQVSYDDAFILWDRAGEIARCIKKIWPDIELKEGQPQKQVLKGKNVLIQTGLNNSTITLIGSNSFDHGLVNLIKDTFDVWCQQLELHEVNRVSTLAVYAKEFSSIMEANAELLSLNMAKWPTTKVFDQPMESELNGLEMFYRFEDEHSFSTLKLKAEQIKYEVQLDSDYVDESEIKEIKNQMLINFDRGMLGTVNTEKFVIKDWIKGFQHVLRRDVEKIIKV